MKVIISHDVDHLYRDDHYFDLIYPKLWVRETISLLKRTITFKEWHLRMLSTIHKTRHNIKEVMAFDALHGIPSTFFFGMAKGLGMSYSKEKALPVIKEVYSKGFDVGVHGIAYNDMSAIKQEHDAFKELGVVTEFGIREHYVRYDNGTFVKLAKAGYLYDSSEFNKKNGCCIKAPYCVDGMWEFPLTMMDGYLPYDFKKAKQRSRDILTKAQNMNISHVSILFHDPLYSDAYSVYRDWYEWLVQYCKDNGYEITSYRNAIRELECGKQ